MERRRIAFAALALCACGTQLPAHSQAAPADPGTPGATGSPAGEAPKPAFTLPPPQVLEGVPAFRYRHLELADLPRPTGPARALFNGRNLDGFEPWLGYALPLTYMNHGDAKPIGRQGIGDTFKVVDMDGRPAICISGQPQGALLTPDLHDYHLSLSFKWGKPGDMGAGTAKGHNTGVLYHSHGEPGGFLGTWMYSVEYEVMPGKTAMMVPVNTALRLTTRLARDADGTYRYMPDGKSTAIRMPTLVHGPRDEENPEGEWNRIDLYVVGNKSVQVLNGVPMIAFTDIGLADAAGKVTPLTHGRVQLQSEMGEVYFRDIVVEPIKSVPRVVIVE